MTITKQANKYLLCWASCVLGALALIAWLNWFINPFSIFDAPAVAGINANKPNYVAHLRLTHPYRIENLQPECTIFGTSRAGRGLAPDQPALAGLGCYNVAVPSVSMYEIRRYFQHVQAIKPQKLVILSLDLRVFHPEPDTSGAFSESRLAVTADGQNQFNLFSAKLPDLASSLLSVSGLQASLSTVRKQSWGKDTLAANGFWQPLTDDFDHIKTFRFYTRSYVQQFKEMQQNIDGFRKSLDDFRQLLRQAYVEGVEVKLIIHPAHAWYWQTLWLSDLWPRFEAMQQEIVNINAEEALRAGHQPNQIWDFSGSYGPALEAVPAQPSQLMHWFWEPAHYKKTLGYLVMDRVMGVRSGNAEFADFGARLDSGGLPEYQAKLRGLQESYATNYPADAAAIGTIVKQAATEMDSTAAKVDP
ncbi:hypothetical protein ACH518_12935 [Methylomonas sp. HW2-6]|uniref:hypothetical protein n=1 Tax=Methylomonas sp. HW2-6 TaxID=3376687 RepID=UPI004041310E